MHLFAIMMITAALRTFILYRGTPTETNTAMREIGVNHKRSYEFDLLRIGDQIKKIAFEKDEIGVQIKKIAFEKDEKENRTTDKKKKVLEEAKKVVEEAKKTLETVDKVFHSMKKLYQTRFDPHVKKCQGSHYEEQAC